MCSLPTTLGRAAFSRRYPVFAAGCRRARSSARLLPRQQAGVTLIELIVASVLFAGVTAGAMSMGMGLVTGEKKAANTQKAMASASTAIQLLGADLRSTVSRDRDNGSMREDALRALLRDKSFSAAEIDREIDIVAVSPTRLVFHSEADTTETGLECVEYRSQNGALTRTVSDRCVAPITQLNSEQLLTAPPAGITVPSQIFSFSTCAPVAAGASPFKTITGDFRNPTGSVEMHHITAVHVDLTSFVYNGGERGTQRAQTTLALRNRLAFTYVDALGDAC